MSFTFNDPVAYVSHGLVGYDAGAAPTPTIVSVLTQDGDSSAVPGTRINIVCTLAGTDGRVVLGNLTLVDVAWSENLVSGVIPQGMDAGVYDLFLITSDGAGAVANDVFTVLTNGLDPISQFLTALKAKLESSSHITDVANVIMGLESIDITELADTAFPRYEMLITKDKMDGYVSQRNADFSFRFEVAGYIKREEEDITFADLKAMTAFAMDTRKLMYSFNDDKQNGASPCDGFLFMGQFTEVFYEFELMGKIGTFLLQMEAHIQLSDTEV